MVFTQEKAEMIEQRLVHTYTWWLHLQEPQTGIPLQLFIHRWMDAQCGAGERLGTNSEWGNSFCDLSSDPDP